MDSRFVLRETSCVSPKASLLAEKYLSYSGVCIVWAMQTLMTNQM